LDTNEDVLTFVDPSIAIEVAWFKVMSGSGATRLLPARVYNVLPIGPGDTNAADKALALDHLKDTAPYVFSDAESQSAVNIAAEFVKRISMMRRPPVEAAEDNDLLKGAFDFTKKIGVVNLNIMHVPESKCIGSISASARASAVGNALCVLILALQAQGITASETAARGEERRESFEDTTAYDILSILVWFTNGIVHYTGIDDALIILLIFVIPLAASFTAGATISWKVSKWVDMAVDEPPPRQALQKMSRNVKVQSQTTYRRDLQQPRFYPLNNKLVSAFDED
jgi:hypothetical protein